MPRREPRSCSSRPSTSSAPRQSGSCAATTTRSRTACRIRSRWCRDSRRPESSSSTSSTSPAPVRARSARARSAGWSRPPTTFRSRRPAASGRSRTPSALLAAGAARVVVGTAAFADDALPRALVERLGERLVVAIDVRDGVVAVRGWQAATGLERRAGDRPLPRCRRPASPLHRLSTRDGTLEGPALPLLEQVVRHSGLPVMAAGGVGSLGGRRGRRGRRMRSCGRAAARCWSARSHCAALGSV